METYLLAVDIGTTSTKGLAVTADGRVLIQYQKGYATRYPQPGYAEQDPEEVFQAVVEVISETVRQVGGQVLGVSFSCAMHSLMAVDENGKPLSSFIIWADTRSTAQAEKLKSTALGRELHYETGTPIHPMSPLCKLIWMKEEDPALFAKASKFISIKEYVFFRLFGEYVVDYSIASAAGLLNNQTLQWSERVLKVLEISQNRFSRLASPFHYCTGLKGDYPEKFKLDSQTKFVLGAGDGCLAHLGSDAMSPGDLSVTIGTSGAVRMATRQFRHDDQGRIFNYRLDEQTYITGGATNNGAVLLTWYTERMESKKHDSVAFVNEALSVPDSMGLIFLPYLQGERSPINDPLARGVFFGVNIQHQRAHFKRAMLEGICFGLKSIMMVLEEVVHPVDRIMASGGFVKSDGWVQLLADILGKPIIVRSQSDASSLGAALQGYQALGISARFQSQHEKQFYPHQKSLSHYQQHYQLATSLYQSLKSDFVALSKL